MKKKVLKAFLVLAICGAASAAFGDGAIISTTTSIGSLAFSPSSKVFVKAASASTGYIAESLHSSGSRMFATDSVASIIYWKDVNIGTAPTSTFDTQTAPTAAGAHGSPDISSGWTSM
jgi:hypothetical protein